MHSESPGRRNPRRSPDPTVPSEESQRQGTQIEHPEPKRVNFTSPEGVDPTAPNKLLLEATARNENRLTQANREDENTLGEPKDHCSSDPNSFLPEPIVGPHDIFRPPPWFMNEITKIAQSDSLAPTKSPIRFDVSSEAAHHNASLLRSFDYDFPDFLQSQAGSSLDFGAEFRPVEQLRPLLGQHPGFNELAEIIASGMPYRYSTNITESERQAEVLAMLARGNHKSAQEEPEIAGQLLAKDVAHGFSMVIPRELVPQIPGAMVQPVGLATVSYTHLTLPTICSV